VPSLQPWPRVLGGPSAGSGSDSLPGLFRATFSCFRWPSPGRPHKSRSRDGHVTGRPGASGVCMGLDRRLEEAEEGKGPAAGPVQSMKGNESSHDNGLH
jgi:hypothetical protein